MDITTMLKNPIKNLVVKMVKNMIRLTTAKIQKHRETGGNRDMFLNHV